MKKILTILLLFACLTSFGQFTGKWSEAQLKLRITRGGDMMWFYFDADGSAFYRATERISIMPYNRVLMVMDSNVVTLQNTKLRYTGIQTTTGKTYYLVMDGDSIKMQVTSITESDPVWAADSAKVLHWADTITKIATQYDIAGFLSVESDPVFAADSAKVLHFADTLTKIATRYNLDTLETVDYWNVQNNLSVTGDILCDVNANTRIGTDALGSNTAGTENTAIGEAALYSNLTGTQNTANGGTALVFNTAGNNNTANGYQTLYSNATGNNNTATGNMAGYNCLGSDNVFMGDSAGYNETGSNKLYIANSNTATPLIYGKFPNDSLKFNATTSTFSNNLFVAGDYLHRSNYNLMLGTEAGNKTLTGNDNIMIGYITGVATTTGSYNVLIGNEVDWRLTSGIYNNMIGYGAGYDNSTGSNNNFMGYGSGSFNIADSNNTYMGHKSGFRNDAGSNNTMFGAYSGSTLISGSANVFLGYKAGYYETAGNSLYIHNGLGVTNIATGKTNSLLYGTFNATTASQTLAINAITSIPYSLNVNTISPYSGTTTTFPQKVAVTGTTTLTSTLTSNGKNILGDSNTDTTAISGRVGINSTGYFSLLSVGSTTATNGRNMFNFVNPVVNKVRTDWESATDSSSFSFAFTPLGKPLLSLTGADGLNKWKIDSLGNSTIGVATANGYALDVASTIGTSFRSKNSSQTMTHSNYMLAFSSSPTIVSTSGYLSLKVTTANNLLFMTNSITRANFTATGQFALGNSQIAVVNDLAFYSGANISIGVERNANANTAGNDLTLTSGGATSAATDKSGGNTVIKSGIATGNNGSDVIIQAVAAGQGTGTTNRVPVTAATFSGSNVAFAGNVSVTKTITAPGTTGNQTINNTAGRVNIAASGTTITVTNSLVTANSIIMVSVATNDATCTIKNVVAGAGSFVINVAATTAETAINFLVIN